MTLGTWMISPHHFHLEGLPVTAADPEGDRRSLGPPHEPDRLVERHKLGRLAVDRDDLIAGPKPRRGNPGVPSNGATTVIFSSFIPTMMPIPPYSPWVSICICSKPLTSR